MFNLLIFLAFLSREQPPPRGCVLKRVLGEGIVMGRRAAASARLCVETYVVKRLAPNLSRQPPPRGCVLKPFGFVKEKVGKDAAASARLCVETFQMRYKIWKT